MTFNAWFSTHSGWPTGVNVHQFCKICDSNLRDLSMINLYFSSAVDRPSSAPRQNLNDGHSGGRSLIDSNSLSFILTWLARVLVFGPNSKTLLLERSISAFWSSSSALNNSSEWCSVKNASCDGHLASSVIWVHAVVTALQNQLSSPMHKSCLQAFVIGPDDKHHPHNPHVGQCILRSGSRSWGR